MATRVQFFEPGDFNPWDGVGPIEVFSAYSEDLMFPTPAPDIHVRVVTENPTTEDIHVNWSHIGGTAIEGTHFHWGSILAPPAFPPTPASPSEDLVILHSWTDSGGVVHTPRSGERIRFTPHVIPGPSDDVTIRLRLDGITQGDATLGPKTLHTITITDNMAVSDLQLCPERESLSVKSRSVGTFGSRNVIARQLNQPQLRTWTLQWDFASSGTVLLLEKQVRSARGQARTFSFVTHDPVAETIPRVRFIEDSFSVTQRAYDRWSSSVDVEEVR